MKSTSQSWSLLDTQVEITSNVILQSFSTYATFSQKDLDNLQILCSRLCHGSNTNLVVNSIYLKYNSVIINHKVYTFSNRSSSAFIVLARCDHAILGNALSTFEYSSEDPVKVQYNAKISYTIEKSDLLSFAVAKVSCYYPHPQYSIVNLFKLV